VSEQQISKRFGLLQTCVVMGLCALLPFVFAGCGSTGAGQPTNPGGTVSATISPSSLSFGSATVGTTSTKTVIVTNTGTANVVVSSITITGSAFSISGITFPLTIAPGASSTANVIFSPTTTGSATGAATIASNLSGSPNTVSFTGTGVTTPVAILNASPALLAFGNVNVGTSSSRTVTLSNTGAVDASVSSVTVTGPGFSSSVATPFTVKAGTSTSLNIGFLPAANGSASGAASITSDAGNSPANVYLSGAGVTTIAHSVSLTWNASTSTVSGYNIYRGSQTGGPYALLNSGLQPSLSFSDGNVSSGTAYYYVVTAVDSAGNESSFSNEAVATVPTP
jgi:hypothetical protein